MIDKEKKEDVVVEDDDDEIIEEDLFELCPSIIQWNYLSKQTNYRFVFRDLRFPRIIKFKDDRTYIDRKGIERKFEFVNYYEWDVITTHSLPSIKLAENRDCKLHIPVRTFTKGLGLYLAQNLELRKSRKKDFVVVFHKRNLKSMSIESIEEFKGMENIK
jgi:hypothetical protein